jgi:sarcosine oxidase
MAVAQDYDVIVAGIGAMGSAAAWQLARRGARVLGLERFGVPNTFGSHHGHSRVIRQAYFEHPDYVPLLLRAFDLWRELEAESGVLLLEITGGLYIGRPDSEMLAGLAEAARLHRLPHERLNNGDLRRRFPQFNLPADVIGVFEQNGGVLFPERCVAAQASLARAHGAELHEYEPALDWSNNAEGVVVTTAQAEYSARRLVLCAGAWANDLLKEAVVPIVPTRQVVGWVAASGRPELQAAQFPV